MVEKNCQQWWIQKLSVIMMAFWGGAHGPHWRVQQGPRGPSRVQDQSALWGFHGTQQGTGSERLVAVSGAKTAEEWTFVYTWQSSLLEILHINILNMWKSPSTCYTWGMHPSFSPVSAPNRQCAGYPECQICCKSCYSTKLTSKHKVGIITTLPAHWWADGYLKQHITLVWCTYMIYVVQQSGVMVAWSDSQSTGHAFMAPFHFHLMTLRNVSLPLSSIIRYWPNGSDPLWLVW